MSGKPALSREAFERQRAAMKLAERRNMMPLLVISVGGGLAQLVFIGWADAHLVRGLNVKIEGAVFLAYMAVVAWLLWRLDHASRATRLKCPQCGVALNSDSLRIAAATGRCDACGGQVIADPGPAQPPVTSR